MEKFGEALMMRNGKWANISEDQWRRGNDVIIEIRYENQCKGIRFNSYK